MEILISITWINFFLFIWFNTDAILSYSKLLRLDKKFKIDKFEEYKKLNVTSDYFSFLRIKHSCFLVNLITCQPCLCFWFCMPFVYYYNIIFLFPLIYLSSYIVYKILKRYVY